MKLLTRMLFVLFFILSNSENFSSSHAMQMQPSNVIEYYNQYIKDKGYRVNDHDEFFGDLPYGHLSYDMKQDVRKRFKKWKSEQGNMDEHSGESKEVIPNHESTPEETISYYNKEDHKNILIKIAIHIFTRDKDKVANTGGRGESIGYVANKMCTHGFHVAELWKFKDTKYTQITGEEIKKQFGVSGRQFSQINTKNQLNVFSEELTPEALLKYISENITNIFTIENIKLEHVGSTEKKFFRLAITFSYNHSGIYYESKSSEGTVTNHITIHLYAHDVIEDLLKGGSGMGDLGEITTICPS